MYNNGFYPTPRRIANEMLRNVKFGYVCSVLEPSAGKGDLADIIRKKYESDNHYQSKLDFDCLEIEPELRHILKGKGYRIVGFDFLQFDTFKRYDWIIMNPPFANADAHLTTALDLLKPGGTCVCILNADTLDNPYTNIRQALLNKLEKWNADMSTRIDDAFKGKDVEREANVTIAIVRVTRPVEIERPSVVLDSLKKEFLDKQEKEKEQSNTSLVFHDSIKRAISIFKFEVMAGMRMFDAWDELKPHMMPAIRTTNYDRKDEPLIKMPMSRNEYICKIRLKFWEALFKDPHFTQQLTSNLCSDLHNLVNDMQDYDFSEDNIAALQQELQSKTIAGVEATIMSLFDKMAKEYTWHPECKTNVHYFNGWATNFSECPKVNNKVILPLHNLTTNTWDSRPYFRNLGELVDIELCLDYLDGSKRDDVMTTDALLGYASRTGQTSKIRLRHFTVTFYKKGTTHITFHDPELVRKLNIFACKGKNWLPPCYGKKSYDDLTPEEKACVDSFEGEQSYREVCLRPELLVTLDAIAKPLAIGVEPTITTTQGK